MTTPLKAVVMTRISGHRPEALAEFASLDEAIVWATERYGFSEREATQLRGLGWTDLNLQDNGADYCHVGLIGTTQQIKWAQGKGDMKTIKDMNDARAEKALDREFNFDGKVMSLRQYLAERVIVEKYTNVEYRTRKKIHLCYPLLEHPKTTYCVRWMTDDGTRSIDVPKLVYDMYDVPEEIYDNPHEKAEWEAEQKRKERAAYNRGMWR